MKKMLVFWLVAAMLLSLVACGSDAPKDGQADEPGDIPKEDSTAPDIPSDETAGEPNGEAAPVPAGTEPDDSSAAPTENVAPSHTDVTLFGPGESFQYLPQGIAGIYACEYVSGDEAVASVDPNTGTVTAVGPGTTKITMHVESSGQYDFECTVRCSWEEAPALVNDEAGDASAASPGTVTPSHTEVTFYGSGESFQYLPQGIAGIYACEYASRDEAVATVDPITGTVTAVGPGTTIITMHVESSEQYDFECAVNCDW